MSYPGNPLMPPIEELETIAAEYVRSVNAGASIVHHHGIHYLEHEMQADGRRLSRIDLDGPLGPAAAYRAAQTAAGPIAGRALRPARQNHTILRPAAHPSH